MIERILVKITSGRFIATIAVIYTYCHVVHMASDHYIKALVSSPDKMEAFVTGLLMGFAGTATMILKSYFDRTDRAEPPTKGEK